MAAISDTPWRSWIALAVLLSGTLAVRAALLSARGDQLARDPDAYRLIAENVRRHGVFSTSEQEESVVPTAFRPPLYPLLLAALTTRGHVTPQAVAALHLVLGVSTVLLVWVLGGQWGLGRARYLAAGLVACDPILLNQSTEVMTETSATFLVVVCLVLLTHAWQTRAWWSELAAGLALGSATLCRPTFLVWTILVLLSILWWGGRRAGPRQAALVLAGFLVVVMPWGIRNQYVLGRFLLTTTHGGYTLLLGNNPSFYDHLRTAPWGTVWDAQQLLPLLQARTDERDRRGGTAQTARDEHPELTKDRGLHELAQATIREQPRMFLYASVVRVGRLWTPLPHQLTAAESRGQRLARWAVAVWYVGVYVAALAGLGQLGRRMVVPPWLWATFCVLTLVAVHSVYWSNMRMRAPVMPLVCLVAAMGCERIFHALVRGKLLSGK